MRLSESVPLFCRLAIIIDVLFTVAIFMSYALQGYVIVEIVWHQSLKEKYPNKKHDLMYEYAIRLLVIFVTCKYLLPEIMCLVIAVQILS